jgi:hypothetical protein
MEFKKVKLKLDLKKSKVETRVKVKQAKDEVWKNFFFFFKNKYFNLMTELIWPDFDFKETLIGLGNDH